MMPPVIRVEYSREVGKVSMSAAVEIPVEFAGGDVPGLLAKILKVFDDWYESGSEEGKG